MTQRLILPLNDCQMNAGYKVKAYQTEWGFAHYGVDLVEKNKSRTVFACGAGEVVACGMDGATPKQRMGNAIVIVYRNVRLPDGQVVNLAARMFHFAKIACKTGDRVQAGTPIGEYGSTGAHSTGPHLHMEFDTDIRYPAYAYGMAASGNVIKRGTVDSTVNPCKVLWLGEGQSMTTNSLWITQGWVNKECQTLPKVTGVK